MPPSIFRVVVLVVFSLPLWAIAWQLREANNEIRALRSDGLSVRVGSVGAQVSGGVRIEGWPLLSDLRTTSVVQTSNTVNVDVSNRQPLRVTTEK